VLLVSFAVGLAATIGLERLAPRVGLVAHPVVDRWHRQTVPLLGGVAIAGTTIGAVLLGGPTRDHTVLALVSIGMASLGLVDDVRPMRAQAKLLGQVFFAAVLLQFGFLLPLTGLRPLDLVVTLFWLVGITNAFNLLDNMDGLAATIALVAAAFRLLFFASDGDRAGVLASVAFIGAVAGFLVRNFPPAKIFMGDAGSLFLGFFLAGLSLTGTQGAYSRGVAAVLVFPVSVLLVPIFDTAFVTVTRLLSGRSVAEGGRDHSSHRLVAIGLSERQVLLVMASVAAGGGSIGVLSYRQGLAQTNALLALLVIGLILLGVYLSRVRAVHTTTPREAGTVLRLLADFQYKRQVLTLSLDVVLILIAYYAAYVLRFEDAVRDYADQLYGSAPMVLVCQLVALAAYGLYRGIWQYTGISDVLRIVKAVTLGTMAAVVGLVYLARFAGFSRTVFVVDWAVLVLLLGGTRASFRFFGELFRPRPDSFRRVIIYGAGDGGDLIVREMRNNPGLERTPVGFIDDDRTKHQTRIHGLPVFGGLEQIEPLVRERGVGEVIVSSEKIAGDALKGAVEICQRLGVPLSRSSFRLE
jgi:UDP-GlcNAc:undecaprenyl-phosphate/decaprenyl-phosphate GlcNAc-1-phosphate transferase